MAKTRKSPSPVVKNSPAVESKPSREAIALRAYEIYLERGGEPGHELEDWTRAEQELSGKNGKSGRKASPRPIAA
ncbi:MAG TPA: DUF2934 domain-containing protein [Candidatus Angelobacter sp.]|nr:DUF2934 domain-containing protein [Candidatus Angelobacter sp.]